MTGIHLDGARWNPSLPSKTPALVSTIELTRELVPIDAGDALWAYFLVLANSRPVGWVTCPVNNGRCSPFDIRRAVTKGLSDSLLSTLVLELTGGPIQGSSLEPSTFFANKSPRASLAIKITVAVCTRDRPDDLAFCLRSLRELDYTNLEVLVVDNASMSLATKTLLETEFTEFLYVHEPRTGLDWARNRALECATGKIIAYTDDDVVVDKGWLNRIASVFEDADVGAVTGLIAPLELRLDSQLAFEVIGGFGRGCVKAWYRVNSDGLSADTYHLGAGRFGAGANMAFRTGILRELGGFDPALDVGTPTEGGGDLEVFFRFLQEGHTLVYEPAALVWHRHRRSPEALEAQICTWGTAMGAYLYAAYLRYPNFRWKIIHFAARWSWWGYLSPVLRSLVSPGRLPRGLRMGPLRRLALGPFRYKTSRREARLYAAEYNANPPLSDVNLYTQETSIRSIDLQNGITVLDGTVGFYRTLVHVYLSAAYLGCVTIENRGHPVSAEELRSRVSGELAYQLMCKAVRYSSLLKFPDVQSIVHSFLKCQDTPYEKANVGMVSVVIATRNRPKQLRRCLQSLALQTTYFTYEVVVVNNSSGDKHTEEIVREFPFALYVEEAVAGLAPARNTGFRNARGDILVATDDDVVAPPNWLEEIVQPFRFAHIGIATGLVAPLSLKHQAQRDFEGLGGLGKGSTSFEVGIDWLTKTVLHPPRVWDLGATANAAFRRSMLEDRQVGLLLESLGPGTPAGGGEDAYIFYRALAAGYGIYYEASAILFHEHRESATTLRRQMLDYSRGHVAYLLTTLVQDGDLRALFRLVFTLPAWHLWRLLRGPRYGHQRRLVLVELVGYLTGPWGWLQARRLQSKLRQAGRSIDPLSVIEPTDTMSGPANL